MKLVHRFHHPLHPILQVGEDAVKEGKEVSLFPLLRTVWPIQEWPEVIMIVTGLEQVYDDQGQVSVFCHLLILILFAIEKNPHLSFSN